MAAPRRQRRSRFFRGLARAAPVENFLESAGEGPISDRSGRERRQMRAGRSAGGGRPEGDNNRESAGARAYLRLLLLAGNTAGRLVTRSNYNAAEFQTRRRAVSAARYSRLCVSLCRGLHPGQLRFDPSPVAAFFMGRM